MEKTLKYERVVGQDVVADEKLLVLYFMVIAIQYCTNVPHDRLCTMYSTIYRSFGVVSGPVFWVLGIGIRMLLKHFDTVWRERVANCTVWDPSWSNVQELFSNRITLMLLCCNFSCHN